MSRLIQKYSLENLYKEYPEYKEYNVELYIDVTNIKIAKSILKELKSKKKNKKFKLILHYVITNKYNRDLYSIESENITAMKFKGKFFKNLRIYCKECYNNGKKVVIVNYLHKKDQKNKDDHKIVTIIDQIKGYKYEFK